MENLKKLRNNQNLTQQDLSVQLNISQQVYSRYENGTREPDFETLIKIADYFNVSVDYLLGRIDENKPCTEPPLTEEEKALLLLFSQIPKDKQQLVLEMIKVALSGK